MLGRGRLRRPGPRAPADAAAGAAFADVRLVARDPAAAERLGVAAGSVDGRGRDLPAHRGRPSRCCWRPTSRPGTLVTSVGFAPPGGELDPELAARPGCRREPPRVLRPRRRRRRARGPGPGERHRAGGSAGRAPARACREIIVYKSIGHIVEDAAAAELVYETALERGLGREIARRDSRAHARVAAARAQVRRITG